MSARRTNAPPDLGKAHEIVLANANDAAPFDGFNLLDRAPYGAWERVRIPLELDDHALAVCLHECIIDARLKQGGENVVAISPLAVEFGPGPVAAFSYSVVSMSFAFEFMVGMSEVTTGSVVIRKHRRP